MAVSAKSWSRERRSVAAHFAVLGLVCATWGTSIDDMKLLLGLDEAQLGWLLFSGPVGCLVSFIFARALMKRLGSRRNLVLSTNLYIASAIAGAACFLMRTPILSWCLVTACLAAAGNLFNISANTQAGIIERTEGQTVMGSFHAIFSLMCLVASAVAVLTSHLGIPPEWRLTGIIAISVVAHLAFMHGLPAEAKMPTRQAGERLRLPDAQLLAVGLAALVVTACEGAVNNWVGVFYGDALGAPPGQIKWGYCAVGVMTVLGRFSADPLVGRFGPGKVFRTYSLMAAACLTAAISSPFIGISGLRLVLTATAGYAVAGFGISALVPILYSRANKTKSMSAVSAFTFVGAMGFLGGFMVSPTVGCVARTANLSLALGIFAALILICPFLRIDDGTTE